jgi:hypothetical protein
LSERDGDHAAVEVALDRLALSVEEPQADVANRAELLERLECGLREDVAALTSRRNGRIVSASSLGPSW